MAVAVSLAEPGVGRGWTWPGFARPVLLAAPLLAFTLLAFALPLCLLLWRAVDSPEFAAALPRSAIALRAEANQSFASSETARLVLEELRGAYGSEALGRLALKLNAERPGTRAVLIGTARSLSEDPAAPETKDPLQHLRDRNEAWGDPAFWAFLRRAAPPLSDHNLLATLDLTRGADGRVVAVEPSSAIYRDAMIRTLTISAIVTLACLALGYPLAFLIANTAGWTLGLLLACLMLPFWTSLLVRTTAWVVLLQDQGVINKALLFSGVIDAPLALIRNRGGVVIAMTHVLLPFMVLPLVGVMRSVRTDLLRASAACGAKPFQTFRRVYWPLTWPGVAAGSLLVFIQSIGYFITPALVGGPNDQMLGYFVALHTNETLDWGMAAALAGLLLVAVLILYATWTRFAPADGGLA